MENQNNQNITSSQAQEKKQQSVNQAQNQGTANQSQVNTHQNQNQSQSKESQPKKEDKPKRAFRIGIIANGINDEDILHYNEQLQAINKMYKEKIRIVVLGYKSENDKLNMLKGVIFEYVKPVSIVHYFKQLSSLQIDLLFIPLVNNKYNATSENYNKYLEAGVFKIPVLAPDIYPYNKIIKSEVNGFIFGHRENFIPFLMDLLVNKISMIRACGTKAQEDVFNNFNYSAQNIEVLSSAFM